ncbi:hypothetical protein E3P92_00951 [Wallemia ichthyophaga]|uniref:FYVE-type domain-containing protein n=1 Tax=Wallemia ichthyophaga TaxID=245174 RepID=A0A4V4M057_WALIC|nr:hypothetical protein E3P91_01823 [Wallemia ichthyophaga]TIB15354.1 hypothetical protein E3P90_00824 [Wallemia ichthyophaga]TIB17199.1 hypothetical protein E3P93_00681 [Wallemia ichthyophaga]TIB17560.1 hypothetical protein E3P92_00951 [Wallemia ichthyophaga]TIB22888.1 hypothetical protein E3P89_01825 [Wallemia ichthyophaga]
MASEIAPEWTDSDACSRCQSVFTTFNRKHHCRNCGRVFDSLCCHKQLTLPHWGYNDPVRVCEGCYSLILREGTKAAPPSAIRVPRGGHDKAQDKVQDNSQDAADADLLKAIQLSLAESGHSYQNTGPAINANRPEPPEDDDDMKAAIEASLKDMRSAPPVAAVAPVRSTSSNQNHTHKPSYELATQDRDAIFSFAQSVQQQQQQQQHQQYPTPPNPNLAYSADRALNAKSRLLAGVNETEAKERVLVDMHAKMTESIEQREEQQRRESTPVQRATPYYYQQQQYQQQYQPYEQYQQDERLPRYIAPPQPTPIPSLPFAAPSAPSAPLALPNGQSAPTAPPSIPQQFTDTPTPIETQSQSQSQSISPIHNGIPQQSYHQQTPQHWQPQQPQHYRQEQQPQQQPQQQPHQQPYQQAKYNALAGLPSAPSELPGDRINEHENEQRQQQEALLIEL